MRYVLGLEILVLIAYASREGSNEAVHLFTLARAVAASIHDETSSPTWVKVFRTIHEFCILRLTFYGLSYLISTRC